jgi:hypothetical protein
MGFYADLEIENMESLPVYEESGVNVGNQIASFLIVYEYYITKGINSPEYSWFKMFEANSKIELGILPRIMYAYSGELSDEEIIEYISHWQKTDPITKEELISRIKIQNKWENIEYIFDVVNEINRILPLMGEDTDWFVKENTLPAFKTLQKVLNQAILKGGKRVRLHFE